MDRPVTIKVDGIGQVLLERSRRAKHIGISIKTGGSIRVAVPMRTPFDKALKFVHLKEPWIKKHLATIARLETERGTLAELSATIDRPKADKQLVGRLDRLAKRLGFTYNMVTTRSQKTRWGSCSQNNNISLNVKLMLLPEDLADYVILHELVHTRIRNHGQSFWKELDRHVGSGKALASRLRKYGYSLL